jgi:hypothetical protein
MSVFKPMLGNLCIVGATLAISLSLAPAMMSISRGGKRDFYREPATQGFQAPYHAHLLSLILALGEDSGLAGPTSKHVETVFRYFTLSYSAFEIPQGDRSAVRTASPPTGTNDTHAVVIIPAFNEEASIGEIVESVIAVCGLPVWVVDDASTDDTRSAALRAGAKVIPLFENLGAWSATQTGLIAASRLNVDVVITMDADGQHEPRYIADLMRPVLNNEIDVAIGSYTERGSVLRQWAWKMMRTTSGLTWRDLTSGYRALNREAYELLTSQDATILEYQDVGVLLLLERAGMRISEVPITMLHRSNGGSRIFRSWATVVRYMVHTLLLGIAKRERLINTSRKP